MAAASTLLVAGGGPLGCAVESEAPETLGQADEALNPGSGKLELGGYPGGFNIQLLDSTTDEFVRVGEALNVRLPGWLLWETLYPSDPMPADARLKQLKATVKVSFVDKTTTLSTKSLTATSWVGTQYGLEVLTSQLIVPAKTDTLKITVSIKDAANATAGAQITSLAAVPVFGGDLPNKSLLFDNNNGTLRQRVVDGDLLVKGSTATIGVSDWRADQIVDKTSLGTQIGTASFNGRLGTYIAPIYGQLMYQVAYGVSFDGGQTFHAEKALAANTASRLLMFGPNRTDYEATEVIPKTAPNMQMYLHIKAFLVVSYANYTNPTKWYPDGAQIQIKEAWGNPSGPNTNYVFQLQ